MSAKATRQWFRFSNVADNPAVAEIHIIDFIGGWMDDWFERNYGYDEGVTARKFVEQLAALPDSVKAIHVHINSPGGDVQAGVNIANALREQASKGRTVETYVDGIAASIASVIAMAGSKVCMADNALMMIHDPWSFAIGNAADMRKEAEVLDTVRGQIVNTYKWHSSLSAEALAALMAKETWMNADEAIANGFATDKIEGLKAAASITPLAMNRLKVPAQYKDRVDALIAKKEQPMPTPQPAAAADVLRLCADAGLDITFAQSLLAGKATIEDATAKVTAEKATRATAKQRADAISALCKTTKQPAARAAIYIKSGLSLDDIKADIATVGAMGDTADIDGSLDPSQGGRPEGKPWKNVFAGVRKRTLGGAAKH